MKSLLNYIGNAVVLAGLAFGSPSESYSQNLDKKPSNRSLKTIVERGINVPNEKFREILNQVKYKQGPTAYAGTLEENEDVSDIERNGLRIDSVEGISSWYSTKSASSETATGTRFRDNWPVVAINERLGYRIPCYIEITNTENGKSIKALAVDHGPYEFTRDGKPLRDSKGRFIPNRTRIVDVTPSIAEDLGYKNKGLGKVEVRYLGPAE